MFICKINNKTTWSVYSNLSKRIQNQIYQNISNKYCHHFSILLNTKECVTSRKCCYSAHLISKKRQYSGHGQTDNEFDIIENFNYQRTDCSQNKFLLKDILYSNSDDKLIKSLNQCSRPVEILGHFDKFHNLYDVQHVTQTVILLWNYERNIAQQDLNHYKLQNINKQPEYDNFLQTLDSLIDKMNADELTCCFLYLTKIGIEPSHPILQQLLHRCLATISADESMSLPALSRFSVAVNSNKNFYGCVNSDEFMKHIIHYLEYSKTAEDIRLVTICMQNLNQLITPDFIDRYTKAVKSLLENDAIKSDSLKSILKIVNFMSFPQVSQGNAILIRDLMLLLTDKISTMEAIELEIVFKVFQSQLEPASFMPKLLEAAKKLFEESKTPEIFACAVQFIQPSQRVEMTELAKQMISKDFNSPASVVLPAFFKVLRTLKISDTKLCNIYWSKVLQEILNDQEGFRLSKYCHRYMFFNNNLGGTYRHLEFEKCTSALLMNEITNDISPSKLARFASFIIAYGHTKTSKTKLPDIIVDKIELMASEFSIIDCLQLSRGFQIALEMRFRYFLPQDAAEQLLRIENVFNNCAQRHLAKTDLTLYDVNCIIRSFNNRKTSNKTNIYQSAIEQYHVVGRNLNSRLIRDITFNLISSNYLIPEMFDDIFQYILNNRDHVIGDTIEKIIYCAYYLGYMPESNDALNWSAEIIKRDFDYMTSLSIVQACLALSFYKVIPEDLINKVFNVEFIRRIEEEIQTCYSKATYPERILNQVMQLNRAICLEFPSTHVPWFQQNYIEAQMSKQPVIRSKFQIEIKDMILSLVKNEGFLKCNHVTPYGYQIDFIIMLDKYQKPVLNPTDKIFLEATTKVAIILLNLDAFCENSEQMKGPDQLKMRHLEMLGYKVLHINLNHWNSMYMNVPGTKINYLKNLLKIAC